MAQEELRLNINGVYTDPRIPYNKNTKYLCAFQGGIHPTKEKLGVPLIATSGMLIIYDSQHMAYKSLAFASIFDGTGAAWPAFKPVLAPADGVLKTVKSKPAMDIEYGLLMFDGLSAPRLGSRKKGEVIGEVSRIPQLKNCEGIMLTCYKVLDGEVFYLPSVYYNVPWLE